MAPHNSELVIAFADALKVAANQITIVSADGGITAILEGRLNETTLKDSFARRDRAYQLATVLSIRHDISVSVVVRWDDAVTRFDAALSSLLSSTLSVTFEAVRSTIVESKKLRIYVEGDAVAMAALSANGKIVARAVRTLLITGNLELDEIVAIPTAEGIREATGPLVLTELKILSTANAAQISASLGTKLLNRFSEKSVKRLLDSLRVAKLISHVGGGFYALTLAGLQALPTRKDPLSSDIFRALVLNRRR